MKKGKKEKKINKKVKWMVNENQKFYDLPIYDGRHVIPDISGCMCWDAITGEPIYFNFIDYQNYY